MVRRRNSRGELVAGVVDAGLSSVATFCVGLYAARALGPATLGAYGLVFTAFVVVTRFPSQLIFKPAELLAVSVAREARLGLLGRTLALGTGPALLAAMAVALWTLLAPSSLSPDVVVALTVTGMLSAFVSPIQDHVRHMLHVGEASWGAAAMSAVLVGAALVALWLLPLLRAPSPWVPLGALAIGNALSLTTGLWMARDHATDPAERAKLGFRALVHSGRWLLLVALLPTGAAFASAALVIQLAGPAAMGYAEAGRVLGQPPWVLSMGLAAVLGPRSVRAARRGHLGEARAVSRLFAGLMLLAGVPYLVLVGFAWPWSPLTRLVPNAYHVPHLLLLSVIGNLVIGMDWPYRSELIGVGRASTLAKLEAMANAARTSIGAMAGTIGAFAIPAGYLAHAMVRSVGYRIALRSQYTPRVTEGLRSVAPIPERLLPTADPTRPAP
jgi:O-antigen/teichoic acid export membrane protein